MRYIPEMSDSVGLSRKTSIVFGGILKFFKIKNMTTANKLFNFFRSEKCTQWTFVRYHSESTVKCSKLPTDAFVEQIVSVELNELVPVFSVHTTTSTAFLKVDVLVFKEFQFGEKKEKPLIHADKQHQIRLCKIC